MTDPLVEQIRANPDDDAPRLAWADREGGVRGELVVIQCRLARHAAGETLPRAEVAKLMTREGEILEQMHAAGDRYERGFAVHASAPDDWLTPDGLARLFARQPLLRSIEVRDTYRTTVSAYPQLDWNKLFAALEALFARLPPDRITEITASPIHNDRGTSDAYTRELLEILGRSALAPKLRALRIHAPVENVALFGPFPALEELWVRPVEIDGLRPVLASHRHLKRLRIQDARRAWQGERLFMSPLLGQLSELEVELCPPLGMLRLADNRSLERLERLSLHGAWPERDPVAHANVFRAVPNLRELLLYERATDAIVDEVARAPFAKKLRLLALTDGKITGASAKTLATAFPSLERLYLPSSHYAENVREKLAKLREAIPYVVV